MSRRIEPIRAIDAEADRNSSGLSVDPLIDHADEHWFSEGGPAALPLRRYWPHPDLEALKRGELP